MVQRFTDCRIIDFDATIQQRQGTERSRASGETRGRIPASIRTLLSLQVANAAVDGRTDFLVRNLSSAATPHGCDRYNPQ